jgi:hypothetical protein
MRLSRGQQTFLLGLLIVSSVALAGLIIGDGLPQLRGPAPETSEWYWPHLLRPLTRWWPAILAACSFWLVAAWWLWSEEVGRLRNGLALTGLFLTALSLQTAVIYADQANIPAALVDRTLSNLASGFFEPAAEITDMNAVLRDYPQQMRSFVSEHARTHPPGLIVAHWATIQGLSRFPALAERIAHFVRPLRCTDLWLLDRPPQIAAALGLWALLPLLAAALTAFPGYLLSGELLEGRARRLAVILAAALPALLLFAPKSVQFYAPLGLLLLWLWHTGLRRRSSWRMLAAGLLLSLLTFISLGNAALMLLLGVYAAFLFWLPGKSPELRDLWPQPWLRVVLQALAFTLGAISFWLILWLGWGTTPWAIAGTGLGQHYELVTALRRYDWWAAWNLIDLLVFSSWPLFLGFLCSLILAFHRRRRGSATAVDLLATALLLLILALDLSGSARGEVGRIWLFFMPLLAFPAAGWWSKALPGKGPALTVVALQLLLLLALGLSWRPVRPVIVVAEQPAFAQVEPTVFLEAVFQDEPIRLIGATIAPIEARPGETIQVTLSWAAEGAASRPFTVFNHLINADGTLVAQQDGWPVNGVWPPTCWRSGDIIIDNYALAIPVKIEAGTYRIQTGLYDARDGTRLRLSDGSDAVDIGTVQVQESAIVGDQ